jgi:hypothetical protein
MFPPQRIVCLTEETVETLYPSARIAACFDLRARRPAETNKTE